MYQLRDPVRPHIFVALSVTGLSISSRATCSVCWAARSNPDLLVVQGLPSLIAPKSTRSRNLLQLLVV